MLKNKLFGRIILNSVLGIFFIFVWSRFVNLQELWASLQKVDLKVVLPLFLILFLLSSGLRSLRLKMLLGKRNLPLKDVLMLNWLSQFLSFSIPVRAGEVAKSVYLTSQFKIPLGEALILVFIDRFLDFWIVLLLVSVLMTVVPTALPPSLAKVLFILFIIFTVSFVLILKSHNLFKKLIAILSKLLIFGKFKTLFTSFAFSIVDGFEIFRNQSLLLVKLMVITLFTFVLDGLVWVFVFKSVGIDLLPLKAVLGNSLSALTFLIPAAPGYVGSAEVSGLAVFSGVLGMEANIVSAAAVLYHLLTLVVLLIFGLTGLYLLKFDLGLVWKRIKGK